MTTPRQIPTDAMIRKACGFTIRWLRNHGLEVDQVFVYETSEDDRSTDVILLDTAQLDSIPEEGRPVVISDLTGTTHLLLLRIPSDG